VDEVLKSLTSLDPDMWGQLWCNPGLTHEAHGDELLKNGGKAKEAGQEYYLAYGYCHVSRYPAATSPGKKQSYLNAMRMFRKAAKYFDTPLQVVEIPFEGKKIVGYLQIPAT
jgi:esterase FrsA